MGESVRGSYEGIKLRMIAVVGTLEEFKIGVWVHSGSGLSLLLFITILEKATKEAKREVPWEFLYASDLVVNVDTTEVK